MEYLRDGAKEGEEGYCVRREGDEERRRVFTFQISRLTRTQVSFPFLERERPRLPVLIRIHYWYAPGYAARNVRTWAEFSYLS